MNSSRKPPSSLKILSIGLYVLAAIVLIAGVILSLSLFNARGAMQGFSFLFQTPALQPFIGLAVQVLVSVGNILLVISLVLSAVLFTCGLLLARNLSLSERVRRLEEAVLKAN